MSERSGNIQADRRAAFLEQLKKSSVINLDTPLSTVLDATAVLPGGTTSLTIAYDDEKWFAVMP
jgi:hypothetical protein